MSTTTAARSAPSVSARGVGLGAAGGLLAGLVFGLMMDAWGMIPMVAMLVGSEAAAVGWGLHLAISVLFGALFGLVAPRLLARPVALVAAGVAYGALLWVMGPLVLMPARLGMDLFVINEMTLRSLGGHLVFGLVLSLVVLGVDRLASRG